MRGQLRTRGSDAAIAAIADTQHGVVARSDLRDLGLSADSIDRRVAAGRLHQVHRGVYAVGHRRLTRDGIWLSAVLAAGPGAALSHRDAGALHGLGQWSYGPVEVTAPTRVRSSPRLRVHARRVLAPGDVTTVAGIPTTTVERTLVDLAGVLSRDRLARALTEAERSNRVDVRALERAAERVRTRNGPGHAVLRAVLAEHARQGTQLTRSELEIAMRSLVRDHGLPPARLNAYVDDDEGDAVRFTHDAIKRRPAAVADEIGRALAARGPGGPGGDERRPARAARRG